MGVKLVSSSGGSVELNAPTTASNFSLTVPANNGTVNTSGSANEVPAGSAAAPAIYPTGDTNTGIFFPAADTIAFAEGGVEAARIDSSGNLLVGTTSNTIGTDNGFVAIRRPGAGYSLICGSPQDGGGISYMIKFTHNNTTGTGQITTTNTTVSYATSSDYRLKHDIQPMTGALAKVQQLKPVTYKWNADDSQSQGFIAHELQAVVPDCVTGEKDAVDAEGKPVYQGIDTSFLVATLTKAIQELKAQVDLQAAEIAALKGATE